MKLFGYSISINVLILIGVFYLIMVVNALSASCNREGVMGYMETQAQRAERERAEDNAAASRIAIASSKLQFIQSQLSDLNISSTPLKQQLPTLHNLKVQIIAIDESLNNIPGVNRKNRNSLLTVRDAIIRTKGDILKRIN